MLRSGKVPVCELRSVAKPAQPNSACKIAGRGVLDDGNSAVASSPAEKRSWRLALPTPAFLVCSCGAAQILAPIGSTNSTRYTCRRCCAKIQRQRNIDSLQKFLQKRVVTLRSQETATAAAGESAKCS